MCELLCDFTVVCEHEDTGGVLVKTTYREHSCRASLEEVHDGLVCVRVACCGDKSLRLVHHDVYLGLTLESLAVEPYVIGSDVDLGSELCDYLSVDCNHSGEDEVVGLSSRAYARVGDELVETDHLLDRSHYHIVV